MLALDYSYRDETLGNVLVDLAVRFVLNCPTEDTATNERLFFQIEEAHWFYEDFARVENSALPSMKIKTFVERLFEAVPILNSFAGGDPLQALLQFQHYKKSIPVRGGIILNETIDKVLMVRGWKGSSWGFPKGKINKNEPDEACAVREVREETGFDMTPFLKKEDYLEITRGGKNIRLYIVKDVPESTIFETQTRKEISKIEWHTINRLPVFNRKASANYYTVTPFMNGLKKYIAKAKGLASSLSSGESESLKKLLGVREQETVRDDKETAERLLQLIKGNKNPLLDLLKGPGSRLDAAQNALGLLRGEIATENVIQGPTELSVPPELPRTTKAPQLPPNDMLTSLVNARKNGAARPSILRISGAGGPSRRNDLLDLIGESSQPNVIDSAGDHEQAPAESENADGKKLLSIIKDPAKPRMTSGDNYRSEGHQDTALTTPSKDEGKTLLSMIKGPLAEKPCHGPEEDTKGNEGNALLSLLRGEGDEKAGKNISKNQPSPSARDNVGSENLWARDGSGSDNKLLSLLKEPKVEENTRKAEQKPNPEAPNAERQNSLLSLLQPPDVGKDKDSGSKGSIISDKEPNNVAGNEATSANENASHPLKTEDLLRSPDSQSMPSKRRPNSLLELLHGVEIRGTEQPEHSDVRGSGSLAPGKNSLLTLLAESNQKELPQEHSSREKPNDAKSSYTNALLNDDASEKRQLEGSSPTRASEERIEILKLLDPKESEKRMPRNLPAGWTLTTEEMLEFLKAR